MLIAVKRRARRTRKFSGMAAPHRVKHLARAQQGERRIGGAREQPLGCKL